MFSENFALLFAEKQQFYAETIDFGKLRVLQLRKRDSLGRAVVYRCIQKHIIYGQQEVFGGLSYEKKTVDV